MHRSRVFLACLATVAGVLAPATPGLDAAPPSCDALLALVVARAREVSEGDDLPVCLYTKRSIHEQLDAQGGVKQTREKLYEVTLRKGMTHNRLVAVNGLSLGTEEGRRLNEQERRTRQHYAGEGRGPMDRRASDVLNEELLSRFEFALAGEEVVRDRPAWVLTFRPRAVAPAGKRLMDRVINLLHGTIWVDAAEHEIVRADVRTEGRLRLAAGVIGSLDYFELRLERERSGLGVWFNQQALIALRGRKLFDTIHFRAREEAGEFRAAPGGQTP